jgi:hypothetical protein
MSNLKQLKSYEDLLTELKDKKILFRKIERKTSLSIPTRLDGQNAVLLILWEPAPRVIQFIQILPLAIPGEYREALTILLNHINFTLPVTGFVMNKKHGVLTYRIQAFLDPNGAIASDTVGSLLTLSTRTAAYFLPQLKKALASHQDARPKSLFDLR